MKMILSECIIFLGPYNRCLGINGAMKRVGVNGMTTIQTNLNYSKFAKR